MVEGEEDFNSLFFFKSCKLIKVMLKYKKNRSGIMKKGFTLIELLAVIVILAIIALIATPIVLNIINDTRESATLRSSEMYLDALELSIAQATLKNKNISDGVYNITEGGNVCLEYNTDSVCTNKLEVETSGEAPKEGTITITNGNIIGLNIILNEKEIMKNSKNQMVYVKSLDEVCEHVSGTPKTAGSKYTCKVDPNKKPYTFYVLTTPSSDDTSINLIMDTNINSDGTPVTKAITHAQKDSNGGIYNLVSWINKDDYGTLVPYDGSICYDESGCILNDKGPLTAMSFLQKVTKTWANTNELIINIFTSCDDNGICEEL